MHIQSSLAYPSDDVLLVVDCLHTLFWEPGVMKGNLYEALPEIRVGEFFEALFEDKRVRIERILSSAAPEPTLYDQPQDEWVCLLRGEAELWIEGEIHSMRAGDYCFIPAHRLHRVLKTSRAPSCLWLAVHLSPSQPGDLGEQDQDDDGKQTDQGPDASNETLAGAPPDAFAMQTRIGGNQGV